MTIRKQGMNKVSHQHIERGGLKYTFLNSGDLYQISDGNTMINQLLPHAADGSLQNLYVRLHRADGIVAAPMLGIHSGSEVYRADDSLIWIGEWEGVRWKVSFIPADSDIWFWDVQLKGTGEHVDVVYGQDVGIASPGAVRSNEAYVSQYIDHKAFNDPEKGWVVCSRQNQPQGGRFPYLQQGSLTYAAGYSTDGFQFFGLSYKETNHPESLSRPTLANEVYQYEFAYTAFQSRLIELNGSAQFVFYGMFKADHAEAVTGLEFAAELQKAWEQVSQVYSDNSVRLTAEPVSLKPEFGAPVETLPITKAELEELFPKRCQEELQDGKLLSFFTERYEHIVLKEKELLVERPHGHILMSGANDRMNSKVLSSTSYMYGIFNSQVVVGNTNFNKMISHPRNALNVMKMSGQRIYIMLDGQYRLLTLPSLFEIGFNYVRWHYKLADDTIVITNYTRTDAPELKLEFASKSGTSYRCLVTNQITMNVNEYEVPYHMHEEAGTLTFTADPSSLSHSYYPQLQYKLGVEGAKMAVYGDERLVTAGVVGEGSLAVLELEPVARWSLGIQGLLDGEKLSGKIGDVGSEAAGYRSFLADVMNGFSLAQADGTEGSLFKVNALAWWYTHNMLVHYSMPHGLEQYGGAAWGTRDVCQGPVEYFMATEKYEQVREILLTVFAHQYEDDGNWPQWFMFDNYGPIQQEESHGDIIVWPLKVLGDYLAATGDYSILQERIPYTVKGAFAFTEDNATLLEHAGKEIGYIQSHFLHDTHLSSYGDGDWDDTLQPANAQLKQYMISSWTVALTYQTIARFADVLGAVDEVKAGELKRLAEGIREDFNRYMLQTEVIPGFVYIENPESPKLMLHPSDRETGIQYRLLPMTRSMISELLTPEQAQSHYELIRDKLLCPDGVRLMNRPAQYEGGVSKHFKRAEQASNFGREIGLQYVHAHIRFAEAMAKLGKHDQVWDALVRINPVGLQEAVPNADLRQSNAYFSSSDGKFRDRYEAQERFDELRSGKVQVKGGWRIYSSGPGIYMNQLISNALGIRKAAGDLVLDPVLPMSLDGSSLTFKYGSVPVKFVYHLSGNEAIARVMVNGEEVAYSPCTNRYRTGGVRVKREDFERLCIDGENVIEIYR